MEIKVNREYVVSLTHLELSILCDVMSQVVDYPEIPPHLSDNDGKVFISMTCDISQVLDND